MTAVRKQSAELDSAPVTPGDGWVTLKRAAKILGWSVLKVATRALWGELEHTRRGDFTFISRRSIDRAKAAAPIEQ